MFSLVCFIEIVRIVVLFTLKMGPLYLKTLFISGAGPLEGRSHVFYSGSNWTN